MHVFGRVTQLDVLGSSDVVVTTGGVNTGHEALWCGVPMLASALAAAGRHRALGPPSLAVALAQQGRKAAEKHKS